MKAILRTTAATWLPVAALLATASPAGLAADRPVDIGRLEYEGACATCHGPSGKGDGPVAPHLTARTPDLTVLARDNRGVYPFDRVLKTIDGTVELKSHGTRQMPVWGRIFRQQSSLYIDTYPPPDPDSAARSRMLALTEYLYRLQAK
jgi:mono/diheme cytochrome c family protein